MCTARQERYKWALKRPAWLTNKVMVAVKGKKDSFKQWKARVNEVHTRKQRL